MEVCGTFGRPAPIGPLEHGSPLLQSRKHTATQKVVSENFPDNRNNTCNFRGGHRFDSHEFRPGDTRGERCHRQVQKAGFLAAKHEVNCAGGAAGSLKLSETHIQE